MNIERYRRPALATALSILRDYHLAEDAVQDALVEAMRSWDTLRDPTKRPAWIRSIVRHRCYRVLRKWDAGALPSPEIVAGDEPWLRAAHSEECRHIVKRMRTLPRPLRDVIALHYLGGCTHSETAAFLSVSESTVNNRLHRARKLLRGKTIMNATTFAGTVISTKPPFIDVRFVKDGVPDVFDSLAAADRSPSLRVVQQLGDGVVRCLLLGENIPSLGQHFVNATVDRGMVMSGVADEPCLQSVVDSLGDVNHGMFETGIKPVDLLCPLPAKGTVATLGTGGTGKMVMTMELLQRMGDEGPQLICLADRSEPALIRDLRGEYDELDHRALWIVSSVASDPEFAWNSETFDAVVYTTPLLGIRQMWPAVDPLHSRSRVQLDPRHARLASETRALIREARARTLDPKLLELLAVGAHAAARRRVLDATDPVDEVVSRARRLEAFLTHPFDIGKSHTGRDGETVPLSATLDGVEAVLAGDCDRMSPDDLMYLGALPA